MRTFITNLISQKILLGVFFCAVLFFVPISLSVQKDTHPAHIGAMGNISFAEPMPEVPAEITGSHFTDGPTKKESDAKFSAISFVGQLLGTIILAIPSALVWVAGQLFDTTLNTFVFGMGDFLNGSLNTAINNSWILIRDICNLAFIFGFVYVGIRTIIDPESASTKRFLSKIIIGALLINFSLFFVKFIVDFANFTSYHLYSTMTNGGTGSLSATIADKLGITSFFSNPGSTETFSRITSGGVVWFYVLAAVLLFIVAFVLFAASVLFITRFVGIVFIMIASPILFAATIFPQTEHYASDLWKKLISYAFFVPVFLLLLLISITIIGNLGIVKPGDGFSSALMNNGSPVTDGNQVGSMGVILNFIVIIFFFIQSLLIAQKMGVAGAEMSTKYAGSLTAGITARMGRATVGRVAHNLSEREGLKDAASRGGFGGWAARQTLKASRVTGDSSFDARNIKSVSKTLGTGDGRKGGYKTVLGEVEKKEKEFATSLGEVGDDDVKVEARKKEWESAQKNKKATTQGLQYRLRDLADKKDDSEEKKRENARERNIIQTQIDTLEKEEKDKQIEYEKEKQRRIIGSTFEKHSNIASELDANKVELTTIENRLKDEWKIYTSKDSSTEERAAAFERITGFKKGLKDVKEKRSEILKKSKNTGYAGVLERSSKLTAWPIGRLVTQEREAGKAIRKSAEKGLPKKKDD